MVALVRIDGLLDPETGETVLSAVGAVVDAETRTGSKDPELPHSVAPMRSARCAQHGSIAATVRLSPANVPT